MPSYVLYVPQHPDPVSPGALSKAVVVKDGFTWWALIVPVLWSLWNRLWLVTLAFVLAVAALSALCWAVGADETTTTLVQLALVIGFALEAPALHGWTLRRRGFAEVDAIVAPDRESAETRLFERFGLPAGATSAGMAAQRKAPPPTTQPDVLGLFPDAEARL